MIDQDHKIPKYSRIRAGLNATFTKATTFKVTDPNIGLSETYTVETGRDEQGDHCFVELVDEGTTVTRIYLPPKVVNAIARQRSALSLTIRRRDSRQRAHQRMANGWKPFARKEGA